MDITLTLSAVEADALLTAFPGMRPGAVIHKLIEPVIEKTGDARLQRLANEYRALSATDQLEAAAVLRRWKEAKYPPPPPPDPKPAPVDEPIDPIEPAPITRG